MGMSGLWTQLLVLISGMRHFGCITQYKPLTKKNKIKKLKHYIIIIIIIIVFFYGKKEEVRPFKKFLFITCPHIL
jgi:hypothetical protein